ncbi:MAG: hypothetical protein JW861_08385 [Bacteroidales bacterium]|nr:hypothetical protein [Bacteroidales bacterium]
MKGHSCNHSTYWYVRPTMFTDSEINGILESFSRLKVLIIGDVMVDAYLWGRVERISPEAPVPIVAVSRRESRLGGAANVALNVKALGATPVLCSVIGNDARAEEFKRLMGMEGLPLHGLIQSNGRITTTKFRVIGNQMQMLRVDEEITDPISEPDEKRLLERFREIIRTEKIDVIIFQDYDKGVITPGLIAEVSREAEAAQIPVAVDPKKRNFRAYQGVTLFKPNIKELKDGLGMELSPDCQSDLNHASDQLRILQKAKIIMVTLSDKGIYINFPSSDHWESRIIPTRARSVADVSGAGDTVISIAACCLAIRLDPVKMAALANLAGGLVCGEVGVVPVNRKTLLEEAQKIGK